MPVLVQADRMMYYPYMASIVGKKRGSATYYYLVEPARANGQPRIVSQEYLEQGRRRRAGSAGAILERRALLEAYHDLRREHTAWIERIDAVFFHQGAPRLGEGALRTEHGLAALREAAAIHLSPAGQLQVATALGMLAAVEARMDTLRQQLLHAARHLAGARALQARLYGVGPLAGLAMTCWLGGAGRFSSSRKAVRFAGLDVTVYSSDGRRSPGHLSRIALAIVDAAGVDCSSVALDMTNFATFIDTGNDHAPIAQRGKAKQKRTDLRLVGLGLVVTRDGGIPLTWHAYPGDKPGVTQFPAMIDVLAARHAAICAARLRHQLRPPRRDAAALRRVGARLRLRTA